MDKYGAGIYPDLRLHFGCDLVDLYRPDSGLDPKLVLSMLTRLPQESMTRALMQDEDKWQEFMDKPAIWWALADLYDAIMFNARASGNWKKKPPKIDPYPRPSDKKPDLISVFGGVGTH
jgi:hypothetical protein